MEEQIKIDIIGKVDKQSFQKANNDVKIFARDVKVELDKSKLFKLEVDLASLRLAKKEASATLRKLQKDYKEGLIPRSAVVEAQRSFDSISSATTEAQRKLQNYRNNGDENLSRLQKKFNDVNSTIESQGLLLSKLGKGFDFLKKRALLFTGAIAGAFLTRGIINFSKEIDIARSELIKLTGATGKKLEELTKTTERLFKKVPENIDVVAKAIGDINTRFGATGKELEVLTKDFLDFSRITGQEVGQSIRGVSRLIGDAGLEVEDTGRLLNILTKASQETAVELNSLVGTATNYGVQFRTLGFSLEESIALLSKWEAEGVSIEKITSGLTLALNNLAVKGFKDPIQAFKDYSKSIKDATTDTEAITIAQEIFGRRAGADLALAIREGRFEIEALTESLKNSEGALANTAEQSLTLGERWDIISNKFKSLLIPVLGEVVGWIEKLFETLKPVLNVLGEWNEENEYTIGVLGKVVVAVGGLIAILGGLLIAISGLAGGLSVLVGGVAFKGFMAFIGLKTLPILLTLGLLYISFKRLTKELEPLSTRIHRVVDGLKELNEKVKKGEISIKDYTDQVYKLNKQLEKELELSIKVDKQARNNIKTLDDRISRETRLIEYYEERGNLTKKQISIDTKKILEEKKLAEQSRLLNTEKRKTLDLIEKFNRGQITAVRYIEGLEQIRQASQDARNSVSNLLKTLGNLGGIIGDTISKAPEKIKTTLQSGFNKILDISKRFAKKEEEILETQSIGGGGRVKAEADSLKDIERLRAEQEELEQERLDRAEAYRKKKIKEREEAEKQMNDRIKENLKGVEEGYNSLNKAYEDSINNSRKATDEFIKDIENLNQEIVKIEQSLNDLERGRGETLGQRNIQIEQELERLRNEEVQDIQKINELIAEQRLIQENATKEELDEARRLANLSPTALFLEQFEAQKKALEEKARLKEEELRDLEAQREEEIRIYENLVKEQEKLDENYEIIKAQLEERITDKLFIETEKRKKMLEELRQQAIRTVEAISGVSGVGATNINNSRNTTIGTIVNQDQTSIESLDRVLSR